MIGIVIMFLSDLPRWWNGRHWGLKIPWMNNPCRFDSCSGHCAKPQNQISLIRLNLNLETRVI